MKNHVRLFLALIAAMAVSTISLAAPAGANHAWGGYHWARTSNPFTLKLGDNVDASWDALLREASADWSASSVLDTTVVTGTTDGRKCRASTGRVEVCNARYGQNGWLGIAQIWASGPHITKAVVKANDTYFAMAAYNSPAMRRFVMCQEVGHAFGLDHQDVAFDNANLGTCMDYTSNPAGPPSNEHPDAHDFAQLESIYSHLDNTSTVAASAPASAAGANDRASWGRVVGTDSNGRPTHFERVVDGQRVMTFVIWAA